jgi:hypothetical protein
MIETEQELCHSIWPLAGTYILADRIVAQASGDPETREDELDGVETMRRQIERDVAEYLARKHGYLGEPARAETEKIAA